MCEFALENNKLNAYKKLVPNKQRFTCSTKEKKVFSQEYKKLERSKEKFLHSKLHIVIQIFATVQFYLESLINFS